MKIPMTSSKTPSSRRFAIFTNSTENPPSSPGFTVLCGIGKVAGDNTSESNAKEMIEKRFQIQEEMLEEEKVFMGEITKVITSVQAFKLSEANRDFTRQIYQMQRRGRNEN